VPANAISAGTGDTTLVDWTGAGPGSRLWSLAFLLWAAGANTLHPVDAVITGYRRHVQLEQTELDRLADAIAARPVVLTCWEFVTGRQRLHDALNKVTTIPTHAQRIAARALTALVEHH